MFSLRYCKDIVNQLVFCYFGPVQLCTPKVILSSCRKLLSTDKQSTSSLMLLWRYCKDMHTSFGYFGHALVLDTVITLTQNDSITLQKTSMFICMQKNKLHNLLPFYVLHFKESCNLIRWQHFGDNLRSNLLPDMLVKYQ